MRALTLHQPWASLAALGVQTIETRSWSTAYRGPLLIHAGKTPIGPCSACHGFGLVAPGSCCELCGGDGRDELMGYYWDRGPDRALLVPWSWARARPAMHPLAHTFRGRGVTMADQTCRLLVGDVRERLAELAEAYDRTPRAWICDYHEGWIDSLEVAERWAE